MSDWSPQINSLFVVVIEIFRTIGFEGFVNKHVTILKKPTRLIRSSHRRSWRYLQNQVKGLEILNGFFKKKENIIPPMLRISIFLELTPGFPIDFTMTPWNNFPFFCILSLEISVFPSNFDIPSGVPITFTSPSGILHRYPQKGAYNLYFL